MSKASHFAVFARYFAMVAVGLSAGMAAWAAPSSAGGAGNAPEPNLGTPRELAAAPDFKEPGWLWSAPRENTPAAQMARAKALEAEGHLTAARKAYNALVKSWGSSEFASEAQFRVAVLHETQKHFEEAFREYQYYLDHYARTAPVPGVTYEIVLGAQFSVANHLRTRLGHGISSPSTELVASMFRRLVKNAPDWRRADECVFNEALSYELGDIPTKAIPVYERLVAKFPDSGLVLDALYRAGFCRYRLALKTPNDERTAAHALDTLRRATRAGADHPEAERAFEAIKDLSARLTQGAYERAEFYDRIRHDPAAAILAYGQFLEEHPGAPQAEKVRARIAELKAARKE